MNSTLIDTYPLFKELQAYVDGYDSEYLVIDTETDGVQENTAKLFGLGLCLADHEAFYLPWRKNTEDKALWWNDAEQEDIRNWVVRLCKKKQLLGHNISFDVLILFYNWGVDLTEHIYADTILLKHLLDEERPFGLKEVAVKYLGEWANKAQQKLYENIKLNGGKTTKNCMEMWKANTEILAEYCSWDCLLTLKLFNLLQPRLIKEGLFSLFYEEEIMPLYREVTIPMKKQGFTIDVPYFQELNERISQDIVSLEAQVQRDISKDVASFEQIVLDSKYPIKRTGMFPKMYGKMTGCALPEKKGKITLAAKEIAKLTPTEEEHKEFVSWLCGSEGDKKKLQEVQHYWYKLDNIDNPYIFNLSSNDHLKWLLFDHHKLTTSLKTDTGLPKVDEDFLASVPFEWAKKLIDYKKLQKLKSTYIEGLLERQILGKIHSTFIQFGPPSGRYASRDPNLQNLPRVKEEDAGLSELVLSYVNSIKGGFIAPSGYLLVNADYSQLEPRAFAEASGDSLLQQVFVDGEDLYGAIACRVWGLECPPNEVKKLYPDKRHMAKQFSLATVYGSGPGRISQLLGVSYLDAQKLIDDYFNAYPGLKAYIKHCHKEVCTKGQVKTKLGRIRHLPEANKIYRNYGLQILSKKWAKANELEELHWKFKSLLNLSTNFPIQGVASHVVNRAAIAISRAFKAERIDGVIIAQVHDELTCQVRQEHAEAARVLMKRCMEETTKLSVPLKADPLIATNWASAK